MFTELWYHHNGTPMLPVPIDQPFKHEVRSQIFCRNQEEHDYLSSLNLMHGRELEIHIFQEWMSIRRHEKPTHMRVAAFAYTTSYISLRGL